AFNLVEPGSYALRIEVRGFKAFVASGISVGAGERLRVDAAMEVGESAESIQVVGESPALQTDSSTVQDVLAEKTVQDLPLNNRNLTGLIQLTAVLSFTPADYRQPFRANPSPPPPGERHHRRFRGCHACRERLRGLPESPRMGFPRSRSVEHWLVQDARAPSSW